MRVLYSKSSSPKMSVDHSHPDMTEVKKVRVEKTLEVPVGEVVPLANASRTAVPTSIARGSVMIGNEIPGFGPVRVPVSGMGCPCTFTGMFMYLHILVYIQWDVTYVHSLGCLYTSMYSCAFSRMFMCIHVLVYV